MEYLLLVHIGPVQDFIASARRSRDLWFGSWLLSELSKAAAQAIVEQEGGEIEPLIFPAPNSKSDLDASSDLNVANKIVAIVQKPPAASDEDGIERAIRRRLTEIREEAFEQVKGSFKRKVAEDQVNDLIEYFWVTLSLTASYAETRNQAEALMAARKSTRNFQQVTWGEYIPKSSLDGVRESVIPENAYPSRRDSEARRRRKIEALYNQYGARPAERLSGVDLLKRHGQRGRETGFPSTSHIAALPLFAHLSRQQGIETLWQAYIDQLPEQTVRQERVPAGFEQSTFDKVDGSLLFESRLAETLEDEELVQARKALRDFLRQAGDHQKPIPYYTLLLADGDRMGEVIDAQEKRDQHRRLSQVLNEFAGKVQSIVKKHDGALVYAGGDDVLAFLPLHTVIECARELAVTFREDLKEFKNDQDQSPTFSAGVAVSHHLEPLSDALNLARQAERKAKAVPGKNALAIAVDMRSGVTRTAAGSWDKIDRRLEQFIEFHRRDAIPDKAAYQWRDAALRLGGDDVIGHDETLQKVIRQEGLRILTRKRAERGQRKLSEEVFARLERLILGEELALEQVADELIIARLFAQAVDQADGPLI